MTGYCEFAPGHPFHGPYHDTEYGFPVENDNSLFERLVLEINQAGLSWLTVLQKREAFREAFNDFEISKVSEYGEKDRIRLMSNAAIIRNRLKVNAAIENAKAIRELQQEHGSFQFWLDTHHPLDKISWVKLFKNTFYFTGEQITGEFLMSAGYLPGAHEEKCSVYREIVRLKPPWMTTGDH